MNISVKQLSDEMFGWTAEASDLQMPPGEWPSSVTITELGVTCHLKRVNKDRDNDVMSVVYGEYPKFLTIFND